MKNYMITTMILAGIALMHPAESASFKKEETVILDASLKEGTAEEQALKGVIENNFKVSTNLKATEEDFARYHTKDYIQHVDGKVLNFEQYVVHRKALQKTVKSVQVVFHDMIVSGNKVVTRHTAHAKKNDGKQIELQVIAIFEVRDGKIASCHELTHLLKGEKSDRDLGSRE
jgi:hypothetical protein